MYPKKLTQKIHQSLSPELLESIASEETLMSTNTIADEENLSGEQLNSLSALITYRIMGLIPKTGFQTKIERGLKINSDLASKIVGKIGEKILNKLPIELLEYQEIRGQKELKEMPAEEASLAAPDGSEKQAKTDIEKAASTSLIPEIPPNNLPTIKSGETTHEVPHREPAPAPAPASVAIKDLKPEKPAAAPTPKYSYPGGADPYREPLN